MNLSIFTVFLKNKNIIFKIRRSRVTDYAALKYHPKPKKAYTLLKVFNELSKFFFAWIKCGKENREIRNRKNWMPYNLQILIY